MEGDYLTNAQGEDVVAGIRMTKDLGQIERRRCRRPMPNSNGRPLLENHYRDMQDVEFTIEKGKLWMLQTRTESAPPRQPSGSP